MPTFIIQGRFSSQAIRGLVDNPSDRRGAIKKLISACGGKLKDYYMTTGDYDFMIIVEAPDGSDAVVGGMVAAATGSVSKLITNRAWTTREFKDMAERAKEITDAYKAPG